MRLWPRLVATAGAAARMLLVTLALRILQAGRWLPQAGLRADRTAILVQENLPADGPPGRGDYGESPGVWRPEHATDCSGQGRGWWFGRVAAPFVSRDQC